MVFGADALQHMTTFSMWFGGGNGDADHTVTYFALGSSTTGVAFC